jgi:DNA-binding NarL/FixJ family response regulator
MTLDASSTTTVLIADDHDGFRHALRSLLETTDDVPVVGAARGGEEAVALAARLRPRVVVMDLASETGCTARHSVSRTDGLMESKPD